MGSAENCNPRVCNHGKSHADPSRAREGGRSYTGEEEVGRRQQTESVAFYGRSPGQERTGGFLLPDWPLLLSQGLRAPPAGLPALFN